MAFRKITTADMLGKGNVGRADTPGVSTAEMQRIMDELPREVIAPAFNELSTELEAETAAADIGAAAPAGVTADPAPATGGHASVQSVIQGLRNYTDAKVFQTGAADMAQAMYDPTHEEKPLLPKTGDGSNVTAAFTEAAQDADIVSGETLSTLFGKIKKRFSILKSIVGNPNLLDNSNFVRRVNQRGVSGTITTAGYFIDRWKLVSGSVTLSADGLQLAAGTVIAQILEYAAGTDVIASLGIASGTASAAYDNATKTYTITATTACTLTWAKLEKGSIATPYVPKGYGAELAECLRYARRYRLEWQTYMGGGGTTLVPLGFSEMRTTPTATFIGLPYAFNCTQTGFALTSNGGAVNLNVAAAGATAYQANILLSADL